MDIIAVTQPHYIRCIKPNMLKRANSFDNQYVLKQLRSGGVMEQVRISSAGYTSRHDYADFYERFYSILYNNIHHLYIKDTKYWQSINLHPMIQELHVLPFLRHWE